MNPDLLALNHWMAVEASDTYVPGEGMWVEESEVAVRLAPDVEAQLERLPKRSHIVRAGGGWTIAVGGLDD